MKSEKIKCPHCGRRGHMAMGETAGDACAKALMEEIEELKKDKARLDWLNQNGRVAKFSDGWNAWQYQKTGTPHIARNDIREAIDMAATPNSVLSIANPDSKNANSADKTT